MENVEIIKTRNGKECLVTDGFQHRVARRTENAIIWRCLKEKQQNCKGRIKTSLSFEIFSKTEHTCIPDIAGVEVKKKMEVCRKRVCEEVSVPVKKIFEQEISQLYDRGYDLVANTPKYENVKTALCRARRRVLGTTQNPAESADIEFPESVIALPNNECFLRLDVVNDVGKRILVFAGNDAKDLLEKGNFFFFDGTFKSCPKQFAQLYTIHVECDSTLAETNVCPIVYALLPDKREATYSALFAALKAWCPAWSPEVVKMDFEAAPIAALNLHFPEAVASGCSFHFTQCLWKKIQQLGLVKEYREDEEIRKTCRMCSALCLLPVEKVEEAFLLIMEIIPNNQKLKCFMDYFVEQWMDNQHVSLQLWNVHGQRHRTNNVVEAWNSQLNRTIGRKQPNVQLLVATLKEQSSKVSHQLRARELGAAGIKRRKVYIQLDEKIEKIMEDYRRSNDLLRCVISLSYVTKME